MVKILDIVTRYLELLNVRRPRSVGILLTTQTDFGKNIEKIINDYKPLEGGSKIPPKFDLSKGKQILIETKVKKVDISYNNINYRFNVLHDDDFAEYHLYRTSTSNEEVIEDCLLIEVNKKEKICHIQSITYDKSCMPQLQMNNNGSTLLKIALKLINTIKDKYKINRIDLKDNSKKICNGWERKNQSSNDSFGKEIRLGIMLTLLTGTTWYGSYGFYPKNKEYNKYFIKNKKIIEKTLLSDIPELKEMIIKAHKKSKSKLDLEKILKSYNSALEDKALLKRYLHYFLSNYDKTCDIFYYFYRELYAELKLTDMYGETFIKDI